MTASAPPADVENAIRRVADAFSGSLGVAAVGLSDGESIKVNADEVLPTASVIKLPILVELLRQADEGAASLTDRVELLETVGGSGVLKLFQPGLKPTLLDAAKAMIAVSDNTATNLVLDAIGGCEPVNELMHRAGYPTIVLHNRVDFDAIGDDVRRLGESSPWDMCRLVADAALGRLLTPSISARVIEILSTQQYLDQFPRYLQVNPYAADLGEKAQISVACKTGFFPGTRVDAGAVFFDGRPAFAYAVANHGGSDRLFLPEAEGAVVNGLIGRALVTHWWPDDATTPVASTPWERWAKERRSE